MTQNKYAVSATALTASAIPTETMRKQRQRSAVGDAAYGLGFLGLGALTISTWDMRWDLGKRLMLDEKFAHNFENGKYADFHGKYGHEFTRIESIPENFRDIWPNMKQRLSMAWEAQKELKTLGVTRAECWKGATSIGKAYTILMGIFTFGMAGLPAT